MRYRISRENIEFVLSSENQHTLVKAIVEVMVPAIFDKLYYYSGNQSALASVNALSLKGLVVMDDSNVETFQRYKRIHYHNGCVTLVPVLSGGLKKKDWGEICEKISGSYNKYA